MQIETASKAHFEKLVQLFDLYRQFYRQESNIELAREYLAERMEKSESIIFIAKDGDDYVGFVQLFPIFSSVAMKRAYILNDLYVAKQARRKGIAEKLMLHSFNFCEQQGARYMSLQTEVKNTEAQKLYEKIGMERDEVFYYYKKTWD